LIAGYLIADMREIGAFAAKDKLGQLLACTLAGVRLVGNDPI
jgi:hypothetical protein